MGVSLRALLGFEGVLSQFCIFVFSFLFLSLPPSKLSLPSCRFQVVASKLSLPSCRFQVVASKWSLPSCRFQVVTSKLTLSCFRFHVVAFTCSRLTSCCAYTYVPALSEENFNKTGKNTQKSQQNMRKCTRA